MRPLASGVGVLWRGVARPCRTSGYPLSLPLLRCVSLWFVRVPLPLPTAPAPGLCPWHLPLAPAPGPFTKPSENLRKTFTEPSVSPAVFLLPHGPHPTTRNKDAKDNERTDNQTRTTKATQPERRLAKSAIHQDHHERAGRPSRAGCSTIASGLHDQHERAERPSRAG